MAQPASWLESAICTIQTPVPVTFGNQTQGIFVNSYPGVDPTGVADSALGINMALAAAAARAAVDDTFVCVHLQSGGHYRIDSPVTVDIGRVYLIGNGAMLNGSNQSDATGVGLFLTSTRTLGGFVEVFGGTGQMAMGGVTHLILWGPGRIGTSIAMKYDPASPAIDMRCDVSKVHITNWGVGQWLKTDCYMCKHYALEIQHCVHGIEIVAGGSNTGEELTWSSCGINSNDICIYGGDTGHLYFNNTHFDYNQKLYVNISGLDVTLRDCWVEYRGTGAGPANYPIVDLGNTSGSFRMSGGMWWVAWDAGIPAQTETCLSNHVSQTWWFEGVNFHNLDVTGETFISGQCEYAIVKDSISDDWTKMPSLSHTSTARQMNKFGDGFFEGAGTIPVDRWFIQNDGGVAPVDRYVSTNITSLTVDTANDRLVAVRAGAGTAQFCAVIPQKLPLDRYGIRFKVEATGTPGTLDVRTYYCNEFGPGRVIDAATPSAAELDQSYIRPDAANFTGLQTHYSGITPAAASAGVFLYCKPITLPRTSADFFVFMFAITSITAGKSVYIRQVEITSW